MLLRQRNELILLCLNCIIYWIKAYNITNILASYNAACGNLVCDLDTLEELPGFINTSTLSYNCPNCSCNASCFASGTCCPDFFFSLQLYCVDATFLQFNPHLNDTKTVAMISRCPAYSDKVMANLCEINDVFQKQLQNVPVSSTKTQLTYRNVFCAKCHDEKEEDMLQWAVEINCADFADFNFLSSYAEMLSYAMKKKCNFFYSDERNGFGRICGRSQGSEFLISTCNVSGTWETFDEDVDFACQIYDNKYEFFKNIFCYLCNPPSTKHHVISSCNTTGMWDHFNADLEQACHTTRYSPLTFPFKNIYCYLCNTNNHKIRNKAAFLQGEFLVEETLQDQRQFVFRYKNLKLNHEKIYESTLELSKPKTGDRFSDKANDMKTRNITNLLTSYFTFTGEAAFCHNYSIFDELSPCSCRDDCYFDTFGCCIDKLYQRSTTCTDSIYSEDKRGYPVFNTCRDSKISSVNKLCEEDRKDMFLSLMPVTIRTKDTFAQYKNIYCAFCNEAFDHSLKTHGYKEEFSISMWELIITCDIYLPAKFYVSFPDYFELVRKENCDILYHPDNSVTCGKREQTHCNMTGEWVSYDPDISFACEHLIHPSIFQWNKKKSVYCLICNPDRREKVIYSSCNMTGEMNYYDKSLEKYCLQMPTIDYFAPYKNIFCKKCNSVSSQYELQMDIENVELPLIVPLYEYKTLPSYRAIFTFTNYESIQKQIIETPKCNESQILDINNECRPQLCYPGRLLIDKECVPLLQTTNNLGYILYFGVQNILTQDVNDTKSFMSSVEIALKGFLLNRMKIVAVDFESIFIVANGECLPGNQWGQGYETYLSIYMKIFIEQNVNRSFIENELVSLHSSNFSVIFDGYEYFFHILPDDNALFIPIRVSKFGFANKCAQTSISLSSHAYLYVHSHVNKLLTCIQTELYEKEYTLDKSSLTLTILSNNVKISHNEYVLTQLGKARICLDKYWALYNNKSTADININPWEIIQTVCSCISLVCLLLTFVTYCIFPSLRSLPGKNNMCLVFAMFCAHFVFQFVMFGVKSETLCKIIGVLIHYFWLSTFGCLNVCSFHMYRVFTSKTGLNSSETANLVRYMLYSYGTPVVIVSLNLIITKSVSENESIGYGGRVCFLNHQTAFIVTFIVPIALVCCLNIYFFLITTINIVRRPKMKNDSKMRTNEVHFTVYAKLFTITGITWVFQIIDAFIPASAFSTIVSLLNSLQGVFIFISYICNKRIFNLFRNIRTSYTNYSRTRSYSNSRTMTTSLRG